jgi:hypothetical protein
MTMDLSRALLLVALAGTLGACRAERHLVFESTPPGAQVVLDGEIIGRTPFDLRFESYGTRHVRMSHPGYRSYKGELEVETPWYSIFPLDLISEILLPLGWEDIHRLQVTLEPMTGRVSDPDFHGVLQRAEQLRRGGPAGPNQLVPKAPPEPKAESSSEAGPGQGS